MWDIGHGFLVLFCLTYGYPISPAFFVQKLSFLHEFFAPLSEIICAYLCGSISWFSKWQSTPTVLPGKSHGRRSLIGYSRVRHDWVTSLSLSLSSLHQGYYPVLINVAVSPQITSFHFTLFFFFFKFFYSNYFAFTYKIKII